MSSTNTDWQDQSEQGSTDRTTEVAGVVGAHQQSEDKGNGCPTEHVITVIMRHGSADAVKVGDGKTDQAEE